MKNILLILLLANILYFMWGMLIEDESEPGVAFVEEADLGPSLDVSAGRDSEVIASVGAVLGSGEPSALQSLVGRLCVTLGPFRKIVDADTALLEYAGEGMKTSLRETRAQVFIGHWVWIQDIADDATAKDILDRLSAGGMTDAYVDRTGDGGPKISLGLFGDVERAEKIELQARSLGIAAEVIPSSQEKNVFFVDIGLPPGRGAGAIVEQYGQERVLMREAATCPQ